MVLALAHDNGELAPRDVAVAVRDSWGSHGHLPWQWLPGGWFASSARRVSTAWVMGWLAVTTRS